MSTDLAELTVIDLAGMGPAARCARALADLGARWIRLKPPSRAERVSADWHGYGALRGAEVMEFDLKHPLAAQTYVKLAAAADIVVDGFRPGVADRLGIGYAALAEAHPGLIYCAATGYGQTGPLAQSVGHDINYQALSGAMAMNGKDRDGLPAMPGFTAADSAGGGWQAALRVLAAVVERHRTGRGKFLDVSAAEGMLQLMSVDIDGELATGALAEGGVLHGFYACYAIYGTADGKALAVGAIEPKFFANLCAGLGLGCLAAQQYDPAAQPMLKSRVAAVLATEARDHWIAKFADVEACLTPVLSLAEAVEHPHWRARNAIVAYDHPTQGPARQVAPLAGGTERGEAPTGSNFRAILGGLGFDPAEIDRLRAQGVVG